MNLLEKVLANSREDADCLVWARGCCNGHPAMRWAGKTQLVRRLLWVESRGTIPAGRVVRLSCGTVNCVNPAHLKLSTYKAIAKECGAMGLMSGPVRSANIAAVKRAGKQARISQEDARAIRTSEETGHKLAARYGISQATVSKIKLNQVRREFSGNVWMGLA